MNHNTTEVLIIGSGISALTCGLLLAMAGRRVRIVERYSKPGGYLHCFERYGHRFETGGHYIGAVGEREPFRALLTHLGVWNEDLFVPLAADGFDVFRFPDFEVRFPTGYEALTASLCDQFPQDAPGITEFFRVIRQTAMSFSTYNFAQLAQNDEVNLTLLNTSLTSVVNRVTQNPKLQCVLYGHCALHGVAPADTSIGMHSLLLDSIIRSPTSFRHGGESLVQSFTDQLSAYGAVVQTGVGVSRLRCEGKRVVEAILDDGTVVPTPIVISAIHPKATFRMLDGFKPSPAFASRLQGVEESIGLLGIYALCGQPSLFDRNRNYYFFDWSEPTAFSWLEAGKPIDPRGLRSAFVSRPDRDTSGTPAESVPLSIHAPAPYQEFAPWAEHALGRKPRAYYERKLRMAQDNIAFLDDCVPGFKRSLIKHDVSTPLTNLRYNGSEEGTAYGIYHAMRNTGARSIGPRTHLENLLLTGQNVLFPGILGSAISGLRTAGNLLGIKRILKDLSPMVAL